MGRKTPVVQGGGAAGTAGRRSSRAAADKLAATPREKQDKRDRSPAAPSPLMAGWRDDRRWVGAIFALAVLLPLLHLAFIWRMPNFDVPIIDSLGYVATADDLLDPNVPPQMHYQSPGYGWLVAMVFGLTGRSLLAVRLAHLPLHVLTALLVYATARRVYGKPSGRAAGLIYVLYGPILFYNGEILNVVQVLAANVAGLYLLISAWQRPTALRWAGAGLMLGLAVATRADVLIFVLGAAVALLLFSSLPWRRRLQLGTWFAATTVLPLLWIGLHNWRAGGGFAMLPTNGGINFFQGNNPRFAQTMGIRIPQWYTMSHMPLAEGVGDDLSDVGQGAFFYHKAFGFIRTQPRQWLACMAYKLRLLVNGYELPEVFDLYTAARYSPVLRALVWQAGPLFFPFAALLPLAVLGAMVGRTGQHLLDRSPAAPNQAGWLWLYVLSMLVSLLGYWNSSRYRLTIAPVLIIWAALAMVWIAQTLRARRWRPLAGAGLVVGLAGLLSAWPVEHFTRHWCFEAEIRSMAGMELMSRERRTRDPVRGMRLLHEAVALDPQTPAWEHNLGQALLDEGELAQAIEHLQRAVQLAPEYYLAWDTLGKAHGRSGDYARAIEAFERVLSLYPRAWPTHDNLGVALIGAGDAAARNGLPDEAQRRYDAALAHFEQALTIHPRDADAHSNIGAILVQRNQLAAAREHFRRALAIDPGHKQARANFERYR